MLRWKPYQPQNVHQAKTSELSQLTARILGQALLCHGEEGFFIPNYKVSEATCPGTDELGPL